MKVQSSQESANAVREVPKDPPKTAEKKEEAPPAREVRQNAIAQHTGNGKVADVVA